MRIRYSSILAAMLAAITLLPLLSLGSRTGVLRAESAASAQRTYSREFTEDDFNNIKVKIPDGIVVVTGSEDAQNVTVKGEFIVQGKKQEVCRQLADEINVTCDIDKHLLQIEADVKDKKHYDVNVFLEIETPRNVHVEASVSKGLIDVRNIHGNASIHLTTGDGYCANITGNVNFFVLNGSVNIEETAGQIDGIAGNEGITVTGDALVPAGLNLLAINGGTRVALKKAPNAAITASAGNGFVLLVNEENISDRLVRSYETILGLESGEYEIQSLNGSIIIDLPPSQ